MRRLSLRENYTAAHTGMRVPYSRRLLHGVPDGIDLAHVGADGEVLKDTTTNGDAKRRVKSVLPPPPQPPYYCAARCPTLARSEDARCFSRDATLATSRCSCSAV